METVHKIVVIDTDTYSGNFEHQMCGFITGQIGECRLGLAEATIAGEELSAESAEWFEKHVIQESDEGHNSPCVIWKTEHVGMNKNLGSKPSQALNNSVGIYFNEFPKGKILEEFIARAISFCEQNELTLVSIRFLEPVYEVRTIKTFTDFG